LPEPGWFASVSTRKLTGWKEIQIGVEIITRPVGPLQANSYFVFDRATGAGFVVDPGGDPDVIAGIIEQTGTSCDAIFITHGHPDHLGGAAGLAEVTKATVYGSAEVEAVLTDPGKHLLFPGMPDFLPYRLDRLLTGGETVDVGGIEVHVIATPGHSRGSLTYFAEDSLFTGDLLFHGSIGRTDLPGGSFDELAAAVKNLILRFPPDTHVYPGHGNTTTLAAEREANPFLTDLGW
jgi:glyoxylase-like metal-dependent hydrolase (beta-lactamase superfamily II)